MNSELLQPLSGVASSVQTPNGPSTRLWDKLSDLFGPTDFVRIINIDTEPLIWQHMPDSKEQIFFDSGSSTVPMKNTTRGNPDIYRLEAGQSALLPGSVAYIAMETLIKQYMAHEAIRRNPNVQPGQARNFSFSDDYKQQELIDQIYLGKEIPGSRQDAPAKAPVSTLDDDLGLTDDQDYEPIGQSKPRASKKVPR